MASMSATGIPSRSPLAAITLGRAKTSASAINRSRVVPEAVDALGGPIDVLVNNAAGAIYGSLDEYPLRKRRLTMPSRCGRPRPPP